MTEHQIPQLIQVIHTVRQVFILFVLQLLIRNGCTSTTCNSTYLQKSGNSVIYVDVIPQSPTGIKEDFKDVYLMMYPNPATDNLTIQTTEQGIIEILNIEGQLMESIAVNGNKTNINVSTLPDGVYFVEMKTEKGIAVKKFVKE